MALLVTFGAALFVSVLLSSVAARSPLSSSLVFLTAGIVAGPVGVGAIHTDPGVVREIARVTLFAVLFADGQHSPLREMRRRWRTPALALGVGMPLTFLVIAGLTYGLTGLGWQASMLVGAVLAPTDPVFAAALVGREDVPVRLRSMLNMESGVNDGLALPVVLVLIGTLGGTPGETTALWPLLGQVAEGVALGVLIPVAVATIVRVPLLGAAPQVQPLGPPAVAILLYAACIATHANPFLAAFVAGATVATVSPGPSDAFGFVGDLTSELAKGFALLAFGALLTRELLTGVGATGWLLAALCLLVGRPVPVLVSLLGSRTLNGREKCAAAWFGPKGFASVVYAVIVLEAHFHGNGEVFGLVFATVLLSVTLHSASDVPVANALAVDEDEQGESTEERRQEEPPEHGEALEDEEALEGQPAGSER